MATLSKKDRDTLIRLTRDRFNLLRDQLAQRRSEVHHIIGESLDKEVENVSKQADKELEKLEAEAKKFQAKVDKFVEKYAEKGIKPTYGYSRTVENALPQRNMYGDSTWTPNDKAVKIDAAIKKIKVDAGFSDVSLREQENEIIGDLLTASLDNESAREFIDRIPTVDKLLPLPSKKELTS